MSGQGLKFVSEEEVVAQRQKRQQEWEKVRKEDDPEECPEEESRTLFEQLQANKNAKDKEFEDETRLRSSIKGLDDGEAQFLNYVSSRQIELEKERSTEEKSLLKEMEAAKVVKLEDKTKVQQKKSDPPKVGMTPNSSGSSKKSQLQLLSGAIKRKSVDTGVDEIKKPKYVGDDVDCPAKESIKERSDEKLMAGLTKGNRHVMVAGILPGISRYEDDNSSTEASTNSSDSEEDHKIYPSVCTQRVLQEMMKKIQGDCG